MHDYCISNKMHYGELKVLDSIVIPSADEFLSQYSIDCHSHRGSILNHSRNPSFINLSNGSVRTEHRSLIKIGDPDKDRKFSLVSARNASVLGDYRPSLSVKHNSTSTNDSSVFQSNAQSQHEPQDPLSFMINSLMGERKSYGDHSMINSRSEALKKSKFAD